MGILDVKAYRDEIARNASGMEILHGLTGKSVMISGATGMIGSYLIDLIQWANRNQGLDCMVYALGRNPEKAQNRFGPYMGDNYFRFLPCDITAPLDLPISKVEYVIHAASTTHPKAYASDPIGTVTANVLGLQNLLEFASTHGNERFAFLSSVEVYGENRGDVESFSEDYCGYINCNTLRAGYPESKRTGEALCQAYIRQKGMNIVIPRLCRVFGPTLLPDDSKALSQFLRKGASGEDIVLKSEGKQFFSYAYVSDIVSGILWCLFHGVNGEAYNVSNPDCDITLKELAQTIAEICGTRVVFELPDAVEKAGYSTATRAILDNRKLKALGWEPNTDLRQGLIHVIRSIRAMGLSQLFGFK